MAAQPQMGEGRVQQQTSGRATLVSDGRAQEGGLEAGRAHCGRAGRLIGKVGNRLLKAPDLLVRAPTRLPKNS